MARKKIREYNAKVLLKQHLKSLPPTFEPIQATAETNWDELRKQHAWLAAAKLVVKPDMLFGQRGKNDLVALNITFDEAEVFVKARLGKVVEVGTPPVSDAVSHFIIERFVPHDKEFYLNVQSHREYTRLLISHHGGIHVEENWGTVKTIDVPVGEHPTLPTADFLADFGDLADLMWKYVLESYVVFEELDFTMMEFNPLCPIVNADGSKSIIPLDMRGELDDQAAFKNAKKWVGIDEFPRVFGHKCNPEEDFIARLDSQTGASLKLTILNPAGRIWLLVAGGGASVIYTDTVCDMGFSETLGNYGEYSGNPTDSDTYQYTSTVLKVATRLDEVNPNKGRCLLIGGGVANFTDVKATFKGIIKALLEYSKPLQDAGFSIYVRRGGPNFEAALQMIKDMERGIGVPVHVFGPDTHMTRIVHLAANTIKEYDAKQ
eukprot:GILI01007227.1.p1 GENE.GILI01007227.1~~GILI01007227.1.p1  ORF type:complete len:433 (-),score=136.79 GILI01007227.1:171-1469(-)